MRSHPRYQEPPLDYEDPGFYRRDAEADDYFYSQGASHRRAMTPNHRTGFADGYPDYRDRRDREDAIQDPRRVPRRAFFHEEEYEEYPERIVYNKRRSEELEYQAPRYQATNQNAITWDDFNRIQRDPYQSREPVSRRSVSQVPASKKVEADIDWKPKSKPVNDEMLKQRRE